MCSRGNQFDARPDKLIVLLRGRNSATGGRTAGSEGEIFGVLLNLVR